MYLLRDGTEVTIDQIRAATYKESKMQVIIDRRGKTMAKGSRYGVAQQARFLRGSKAGNAVARAYIASAKSAYAADAGPFEGWTAGQQKHNRLVQLA